MEGRLRHAAELLSAKPTLAMKPFGVQPLGYALYSCNMLFGDTDFDVANRSNLIRPTPEASFRAVNRLDGLAWFESGSVTPRGVKVVCRKLS